MPPIRRIAIRVSSKKKSCCGDGGEIKQIMRAETGKERKNAKLEKRG